MSKYYRTLLSLGTPTPPVFVAPVSDLVASNPTDTTMDLDWTAPVGSDNAIDYYEVWVDGVFYENTVDDSVTWEVTGLATSTEYDFQLKTVDVLGNKSELSNTATEETTGGFSFVADLVSGMIHGYSQARKLRSAYANNILEVRRSSDNTATDIGFASDLLDESALTTFVGANNGFVRTLYDQVGSRNMVQTGTTFQPQIVTSGTVVKVSGVPCAQYDGSDDFLITGSATPTTDDDCTVFVVFESQASVGQAGGTFAEQSSTTTNHRVTYFSDTRTTLFRYLNYAPQGSSNLVDFPSQQPTSTKRVYIFRKTGTTIEVYDESGLVGSVTSADTFSVDTVLELGRQLTGNFYFGGKLAELLINNTALGTTDRNLVLNNIKSFYSIT